MHATWRNTLRIAGTYPHEKAVRVNAARLAERLPGASDVDPTLRVYHQPPFPLLSRLSGTNPLYVMQVTDLHISSASDLDTLEAETYRRSNLHVAWGADPTGPFDCEGLYTPRVTVFKEADGTIIDPPYEIAVFAVKFPKNPTIHSRMEDGHPANYYESARVVSQIRDLLCRAFIVARAHDHPALVFGDLGVHNGHPPTQIAHLLQEVLGEHPVPLVVVAGAAGGPVGNTKKDAEYEELYRALRG